MLGRLAFLLSAIFLGGCAALPLMGGGAVSNSNPDVVIGAAAPPPSTFDFVGRSTKFLFVSPAALLTDSDRIRASIIQEQCMFQTPDPPFLVPSLNQKWLFIGRLNQNQIIQALEYKSIFTLGLTGTQQLSPWPVSMVALSDFPDSYLADRLAALSKAQPDIRSDVLAEYLNNSNRIRSATNALIEEYNPQVECLPRK